MTRKTITAVDTDAARTMSVDELAGQMLMIDFTGYSMDTARAHLASRPWGGYILFAKNVRTREELVRLNGELMEMTRAHACAVPPFIALDQEGGIVNRIAFHDFIVSPGNMAIAAAGDRGYAYDASRTVAVQLRELGFHVNFAPCVDVNLNPQNPIIGVRSFSEDPQEVAELGAASIRGCRDGGVLPVAKHFPGHGDTSLDSHLALPRVDFPMERLERIELLPFRAALDENVEGIMTAHIVFSALDSAAPATLSKAVMTGLLREKMGFGGLIFTDALSMKAIADHYGVESAAVQSVEAGCDILLACGGADVQERMFRALRDALVDGRLDESDIRARVQRILAMKRRFIGGRAAAFHRDQEEQSMRHLAAQSLTVLRNDSAALPLYGKDRRLLVLTPDVLPSTGVEEMQGSSLASRLARHLPHLEELSIPSHGEGFRCDEIVQRARACDTVILCLYARDRLPGHLRELAVRLASAHPRVVTIALGSPYVFLDIPATDSQICTYNYTALTLDALADALAGAGGARGHLPVTLPGLYGKGHGITLDGALPARS